MKFTLISEQDKDVTIEFKFEEYELDYVLEQIKFFLLANGFSLESGHIDLVRPDEIMVCRDEYELILEKEDFNLFLKEELGTEVFNRMYNSFLKKQKEDEQ